MNKIDAIRVSTAWSDSETLKGELKVELNSIEYQAILTNIDNYDTTLSYLSGIIWKYYKSYYLTTSTKERCVELLANELSGKLNYYYALINQYKEAYNKNYETIRSSENTNDRNITTSRTGFNKQATTPETIDAGAEYIDNYSTSQQKYNSSGTELGKNTFKSNISGSSKELWENINAIPKRIYEGIIGLVSKYFFYVYDDDLVPCVELTLEQAIKELNDKLNILEPKVETNSINIRTIGGVVDDLQRRERVLTESIENLTKVTPTNIDYNEGFTLMHDTTEITGQTSKVKLGTNLTYDPATKTLNAKGGGGGESVSPTLFLNDMQTGNVRTTITEQEKTNLDKGLYNQVVYSTLQTPNDLYLIYSPSKLFNEGGAYQFMVLNNIVEKGEQKYFTGASIYTLIIGEKNASDEYPITIEEASIFNLGSSDTNINLYQHSINISGTDQGGRGIDVYITIISSKNLNVNSLPNLKALLGNTFLYSATGFYDTSFVYAITQNGILFNLNGSGEVCSYDIIGPIFEDTVTTI